MAVQNNQAIQFLVGCIERSCDRAGLSEYFRQPCNVLNHQMRVTERRVVIQLPLKATLTDAQVKKLKDILEIELPFNTTILDFKVWQPTGGYLGFVNLRLSTSVIWPSSSPVELPIEVEQQSVDVTD